MTVSTLLLSLGSALLHCVLQVESSGYLQVGFFLYEMRHEIAPKPIFNINERKGSVSRNVTSDVTVDIDKVMPWQLRSLLPDVEKTVTEAAPSNNMSGSPLTPWKRPTSCNTTSSARAQYHFLLCLDYANSESEMDACRLGHVEIGTFVHLGALGRDLVTFPSTLALTSNGTVTSNPMVFGFDQWLGPVQLKVYVTCCAMAAQLKEQCEENLSYTISQTPAPFSLQLSPQTIMLIGNGRLMLYLLLQCDENYYGSNCTNYCRVEAPAIQHAFCNQTTGRRQCLPGWEGLECQVDRDECRYNFCKNGANCVNSPPGSFTCQCQLGTVGRLCEARAPVCHTTPCQNNGTCNDTPFGFVCFCPIGFAGNLCQRVLNVTSTVENVTSVSLLNNETRDIGNVAYSNDNTSDGLSFESSEMEHWYTAMLASGCVIVFVVLIVIIGCLLKGRIVQYGINAKGSFYSVFITTKTFDNEMFQDEDDSDNIIDTDDNSSNIVGGHSNSLRKVSDVEMRVKRGGAASSCEGEALKRYFSHLPTPRSSGGSEGQYIDLMNLDVSSAFSDYEGLPNLVHPQSSPLMVHRTPTYQSSPCPERVQSQQSLTPVAPKRTKSGKLSIPKMVITQPRDLVSGACASPKPLSTDTGFPRVFSGECESRGSLSGHPDSPMSIFRSRLSSRDVFSIGGTLSSDDCSPSATSKYRTRKSLLGVIHARKKPSEPKLCSLRRVDSGGYEVPAYLSHPKKDNYYNSLHRPKTEEHVYEEIRRNERADTLRTVAPAASGQFMESRLQVPGRQATENLGVAADSGASVRSEVHRYAEIDIEHFSTNLPISQKTKSGEECLSLCPSSSQLSKKRISSVRSRSRLRSKSDGDFFDSNQESSQTMNADNGCFDSSLHGAERTRSPSEVSDPSSLASQTAEGDCQHLSANLGSDQSTNKGNQKLSFSPGRQPARDGTENNQLTRNLKRNRKEILLKSVQEGVYLNKDSDHLDKEREDKTAKDKHIDRDNDSKNSRENIRVFPELNLPNDSKKPTSDSNNETHVDEKCGNACESETSETGSYQDVFGMDSDDDMWSDGDYRDVFTRRNAAV